MSAFKQRLAKVGARAGLLAGATAAVLAFGGAGASSALAVECPTATIAGKGASLQKVAQEFWTGREAASPFAVITPEQGYQKLCGATTTVTYESTGSGPGLEAWHFTGAGPIDTSYQYIGTDDAPSEVQINRANEGNGEADVVVIPVAGTAIAIPAFPPAGCEVEDISSSDLEEVFRGSITQWSGIAGATPESPGDCSSAISRVVRQEGSGTTYQFMHYLSNQNPNAITCAPVSSKKWTDLQLNEASPNTTWPCETANPVIRGAGGSKVVQAVAAEEGRIGYAALPDVMNPANGEPAVLKLDGISPISGETASCGSAKYSVPAQAQSTGSGINVDWSGVYPEVGTGPYSICVLTFDLGWDKYSAIGGSFTEAKTKAVIDFLKGYVTATPGQNALAARYYSKLPTAIPPVNNVLAAAEFAAGKIAH